MKHITPIIKPQIFSLTPITFGTLLFLPFSLVAVDLDSPAPPGDIGSAMYTLKDICYRLKEGTAGEKRGEGFVGPKNGPKPDPNDGSSSDDEVDCSLDDVMGAAPAEDNIYGAAITDVLLGKTFWGLRTDGTWGLQTGTLATQTPDNTTVKQPAGYYDVFDLSAIDTYLETGNIKSKITIFGIVGDSNVVDTSSGDAISEDIALGKKAWVDGSEVTGIAIAPVARTGQTTSHALGDDGALKKGAELPSRRFTDNDDGTVTDNFTNLIWLKDASCFGRQKWAIALSDSNNLSEGSCDLTDGSSAGDWRLPNRNELNSLINAEYSSPAMSNAAGTAKWGEGDGFSGVQIGSYWTATTVADADNLAWSVNLNRGSINIGGKTYTNYVWPVRAR